MSVVVAEDCGANDASPTVSRSSLIPLILHDTSHYLSPQLHFMIKNDLARKSRTGNALDTFPQFRLTHSYHPTRTQRQRQQRLQEDNPRTNESHQSSTQLKKRPCKQVIPSSPLLRLPFMNHPPSPPPSPSEDTRCYTKPRPSLPNVQTPFIDFRHKVDLQGCPFPGFDAK